MSRLTDEVGKLVAAASKRDLALATLEGLRQQWAKKAAEKTLAAAFGPTALAAVEALEDDGHGEQFTLETLQRVRPAADCSGCAVLRSWEQALGIGGEQSDA